MGLKPLACRCVEPLRVLGPRHRPEMSMDLLAIHASRCLVPALLLCLAVGGTSTNSPEYDPEAVTTPSSSTPGVRRQCCGPYCQPDDPEYDPETEQCCGEGTVFFATVRSRESGCCPGAYSGRPQCFDQGSSQCCGVSSNDMPLVCGLDVTCPPPDQYRQCPATGGAATVANNSIAAELAVAATSLRGTSTSGVRRQCCGPYCQPDDPEYDPETEQCCGEGTVFFATVCSRESGCCPGAYS